MAIDPNYLTARHKPGFKGLLAIYQLRKLKKGMLICAVISLFIVILSLFFNNLLSTLKIVVEFEISIIPSLLGFFLAGYVILISFGNMQFLIEASKEKNGNRLSLYQSFSSVFAFSIISLTIILGFAIICRLVSEQDFSTFILFNETSQTVVNCAAVLLNTFFLFYSIIQLFFMTINVFNFAQAHHLFLVLEGEKIKNGNEKSEDHKPEKEN